MPLGLAADLSVERGGPRFCAPPSWFRGAEGVRSAWPTSGGPFGRTPTRLKGTSAQRAGIRYERNVIKFLTSEFAKDFTASQWFAWHDDHERLRYCQVDGLLRLNNLLVIVEIKVNFSSDAWWQLRKLYEPIIKKVYSPSRLASLVVCKSFDPAVPFPEEPSILPQIRVLCSPEWNCTQIGVFQWR
jgi:hypothetical protein